MPLLKKKSELCCQRPFIFFKDIIAVLAFIFY